MNTNVSAYSYVFLKQARELLLKTMERMKTDNYVLVNVAFKEKGRNKWTQKE